MAWPAQQGRLFSGPRAQIPCSTWGLGPGLRHVAAWSPALGHRQSPRGAAGWVIVPGAPDMGPAAHCPGSRSIALVGLDPSLPLTSGFRFQEAKKRCLFLLFKETFIFKSTLWTNIIIKQNKTPPQYLTDPGLFAFLTPEREPFSWKGYLSLNVPCSQEQKCHIYSLLTHLHDSGENPHVGTKSKRCRAKRRHFSSGFCSHCTRSATAFCSRSFHHTMVTEVQPDHGPTDRRDPPEQAQGSV